MSIARVDARGVLRLEQPGGQVLEWRVALGRAGIRAAKQEGDGATPQGLLPLRRVFYRADRLAPPRCAVARVPLQPEDGWCDDPGRGEYNRLVRRPFDGRHECLWRDDGLYDVVGVLGWNDAPAVAGRGSAIFLHVATADYAPTAGCVALTRTDLVQVLMQGVDGIAVS